MESGVGAVPPRSPIGVDKYQPHPGSILAPSQHHPSKAAGPAEVLDARC
jgi:hypothetical protein